MTTIDNHGNHHTAAGTPGAGRFAEKLNPAPASSLVTDEIAHIADSARPLLHGAPTRLPHEVMVGERRTRSVKAAYDGFLTQRGRRMQIEAKMAGPGARALEAAGAFAGLDDIAREEGTLGVALADALDIDVDELYERSLEDTRQRYRRVSRGEPLF